MSSELGLFEENPDHAASGSVSSSRAAPWYCVPQRAIVSIEHPFIVNDVSKVVETLGGPNSVAKVQMPPFFGRLPLRYSDLLQLARPENDKKEAALLLRPSDRMSQPISSGNVRTNDVLVHITVPMRTGRKRKRGSHAPYEQYQLGSKTAQRRLDQTEGCPEAVRAGEPINATDLLRRLEDSHNRYQVKLVGIIDRTHRFRGKEALIRSFVGADETNRFAGF